MKLNKIQLVVLGVALIIVTIIVYFTPNNIIKVMNPKRYVFNSITHTSKTIYNECNSKKESPVARESTFSFAMLDSNTQNNILSFSGYNNKNSFAFSSTDIFKKPYVGIFKANDIIKKYFALNNIYNKCFDVDRTGKKYFGIIDLIPQAHNTNEFTLRLSKKGIPKAIDFINKNILSSINDQKSKEAFSNIVNNIDENVNIKIHTDSKHRIVGITVAFKQDGDDVFIQFLFKDENVLINNFEFLYYKNNSSNNLIVNIKSAGNHKPIKGEYTDNTSINIVSSYVQIARLNIETKIDFNRTNDNAITSLNGKIIMMPISVKSIASYNNSENKIEFKDNIKFSFSDIVDKNFDIKFNSKNENTLTNKNFDVFWNLKNEEKEQAFENVKNIFINNFLPYTLKKGLNIQ